VKAAHAPLACVARHRYDEVPRSMSALPIPILPAVARALLRVAAFAATLLLSAVASGQGWETGSDGLAPIPPLRARVTDLTATLSAGEAQALEAKLAAWERDTGNQMAVLIVPSTRPEPIEAYSIRVAEAWKIGRKGQDNGVLFLIAKDDRKLRFEVGYGLEGALTDATARRIIAETVAPLFRQSQFAAGINAGADRVIGVVGRGEPLPAKAPQEQRAADGIDFWTLLIALLVVAPVLGGILARIFGTVLGSTVGSGVVGTAAFFFGGSLLIAIVATIVGFFIMLIFSGTGGIGRGGGGWVPIPGGGWGGGGGSWGGGGGGGGGFSGGGGSFGGGGASGGW
jgi:uncharacterized protein